MKNRADDGDGYIDIQVGAGWRGGNVLGGVTQCLANAYCRVHNESPNTPRRMHVHVRRHHLKQHGRNVGKNDVVAGVLHRNDTRGDFEITRRAASDVLNGSDSHRVTAGPTITLHSKTSNSKADRVAGLRAFAAAEGRRSQHFTGVAKLKREVVVVNSGCVVLRHSCSCCKHSLNGHVTRRAGDAKKSTGRRVCPDARRNFSVQ